MRKTPFGRTWTSFFFVPKKGDLRVHGWATSLCQASALFRLGKMYFSKEGFTKRVYCWITASTSRPPGGKHGTWHWRHPYASMLLPCSELFMLKFWAWRILAFSFFSAIFLCFSWTGCYLADAVKIFQVCFKSYVPSHALLCRAGCDGQGAHHHQCQRRSSCDIAAMSWHSRSDNVGRAKFSKTDHLTILITTFRRTMSRWESPFCEKAIIQTL